MPLTGDQVGKLRDAIVSGFDRPGLEQLVRIGLSERLDRISPDGPLDTVVFNLIPWSELHSRTVDLIPAVPLAWPRRQARAFTQENPPGGVASCSKVRESAGHGSRLVPLIARLHRVRVTSSRRAKSLQAEGRQEGTASTQLSFCILVCGFWHAGAIPAASIRLAPLAPGRPAGTRGLSTRD
jgi:hypothetical protein